MVSSGSRIDGGTQVLSAGMRKTIQSIKEIVGNHSEIDIYWALKETNMDPNETTQKLLNQDPFHEVKRRRDKKKENMAQDGYIDPQRHSEFRVQGMKSNTSDRNIHRRAYVRNALPAVSREFRVVRDNRVNRNVTREVKSSSLHLATSGTEKMSSSVSGKGPLGSSFRQKPSGSDSSSHALNGPINPQQVATQDGNYLGISRKEVGEKKVTVSNAASQVGNPNLSRPSSATMASNSSAVGLYSSSTDPVHVPSPDSRSSASIGAIKREVGVVGVRGQPKPSGSTKSSLPGSSFSNSHTGTQSSAEFRSISTISKNDQLNQTSEPVMPIMSVNRSFLSSQNGGRLHSPPVGHPKASQPSKEWKPKTSQKAILNSPGVIGTPKKTVSSPALDAKDVEPEAAKMQDKVAQLNIHENQNVIIAQHIRVPETDRCQLTFGSFGTEFGSMRNLLNEFPSGVAEESYREPAASSFTSPPESSNDDGSGSKPVGLLADPARNSGYDSPPPGEASEHQFPDKKESTSPQKLDNYAEIGLVRDNSPSCGPSESHRQDPSELPGFSAYDLQSSYDIPYFRPTMDEAMRGQGLSSPQEVLSSHNTNSIPASTVAIVQHQQQPPVAQMYPQVHVSHFTNLMPYRQFLSPVYVPPMAMPGYSSNPTYPHPSNGNSYLLMPGGSTHLNANNLKYGVQQFKSVPAGSPTGYGNFTNPNGYAMNTPGVVGSANGLEDSSRMKYKDGNIYVPNPQAETSEIWIQNPRELSGLQSTPYYNMPGQTPHAAYLPSHTGHTSFNPAAVQSSHMQFPGLYHPPPPTAIANHHHHHHHLGPAMGGNVGVGVAAAAPGAQVGAYQQPQLGHLNWTTNF